MHRLTLFFALGACLFLAKTKLWAESDSPAATVILLEGDARFDEAGVLKPVELGQYLTEGDRVLTLENSSLHLVLADGSSLVLLANSEVTLRAMGNGKPGSRTILQVLKGLLNLMVEKQAPESSFEVETSNAVAAVKGTDFEVNADSDDTQVTVNEGEVHLGDLQRKRFEAIHPLEQARLHAGRLDHANRMAKRDLGEFRQRWERAHLIHQQRQDLVRHFREQDAPQRKKMNRRRHKRLQQLRRINSNARTRSAN